MSKSKLTTADKRACERLNAIYLAKKEASKDNPKEERMTQTLLAQKMGFSQQTAVSKFLRGESPLNPTNIAKFAKILGVLPTDIEPNFFRMLEIEEYVVLPISIPVRGTLSGAKFTKLTTLTSIKDDRCMEQYAIIVDNDLYKHARIRKQSELIIGKGLAPNRDDDVFIKLDDGEQLLGQYIGLDANKNEYIVTDLRSGDYRYLPLDRVEVFDVILGIQRPR